MTTTQPRSACRTVRDPSRQAAKSDRVYAPERRRGAVTSASSTTWPAAAPIGSHSMSAPYASTRPAMPRKAAAEMYSPLIAEAFHQGETSREAVYRLEAWAGRVRADAPTREVMSRVSASMVIMDAPHPDPASRALVPGRIGEGVFGARGEAYVAAGGEDPDGLHASAEDQPGQTNPQEAHVGQSGGEGEQHRQAGEEHEHDRTAGQGQPGLGADQRPDLRRIGIGGLVGRFSAAGAQAGAGDGYGDALGHLGPRASCRNRRTSRSRTSRVCRLATSKGRSPTWTTARPSSKRSSLMCAAATSVLRWMRMKPTGPHRSASAASGTRTR